jgi:hypothetical protein
MTGLKDLIHIRLREEVVIEFFMHPRRIVICGFIVTLDQITLMYASTHRRASVIGVTHRTPHRASFLDAPGASLTTMDNTRGITPLVLVQSTEILVTLRTNHILFLSARQGG